MAMPSNRREAVAMEREYYGEEEVTAEDRAYRGSRFSEVRDAVFANRYQRVWGAAGEPALPIYGVTLGGVLRGAFGAGRPYLFRQAVTRAVDSHGDLRWGPDRRGFHRIIHPNGICLFGAWEITEPTDYSGYFRQGSRALLVARYSTCCTQTRRGHERSLSLVGKLFPTSDPNHAEPLRTASVFTQQDIGGDRTGYINDVELRNAPNTSIWRRGLGAPVLAVEGLIFGQVDKQPTIRQLYQIAELGKPENEPTRAPNFMRLLVDPGQPRIEGDGLDFRDEIMAQLYDRGDPAPKRHLVFTIDVTDDGVTRGPNFFQRRTFANWTRIGRLVFDEAAVSYNGDFVIHFNHPTWRDDRNDPATATRINERKVR
ncbi:MAG TPA: hypothetical protein VFQ82_13285 [Stellaceae bacterium]|nr:hypothetical protein [Stellaceae bacterium]